MTTQTQAATALAKVKPVSRFAITGVIQADPNLTAAALLRFLTVEGAPVFWVGILDVYGKAHVLLCHELEDDGEELLLRGVHGGGAFVALISYHLAAEEPSAEDLARLSALSESVSDAQVIGPSSGPAVEPQAAQELAESPGLYQ
jgi:hypothetical protein